MFGYSTMTACPLDLGPISTDSTRPDDWIAALLDTARAVLADLRDRTDHAPDPASADDFAEARDNLAQLINEGADLLARTRPEDDRPAVLDESDETDLAQWCADWIDDACQTLECLLPPHVQLGTLDGDGACLGIWVDVETARADAEHVIGDLADLEEDRPAAPCFALLVNDHGNATLYQLGPDHDPAEIWGVV